MLKEVEAQRLITGIRITKSVPSITHLLFADDLLLVSKVNPIEMRNVLNILKKYEAQMVNKQKSDCLLPNH